MALDDVDRWRLISVADVPCVAPVGWCRMPTPVGDMLAAVVGAEAHRSNMPRKPGGEWDAWRKLPPRRRRQLIGARYARHGACEPDVLADIIAGHVRVDDPLSWYLATAHEALIERRRAAHYDRHLRVAVEHGAPSYYARRTAVVRSLGHSSVWAYRKAQGWS